MPRCSVWYENKNKKDLLHKTWNTAVKPPGIENITRASKEQSGSRFKVQSDQYSNEEIKGKLYTDYLYLEQM